jgi:TolB protein
MVGCEAGRVFSRFRQVPWWLRLWLAWCLVAVCVGVRSWQATNRDLADPSQPGPDISVALSGDGKTLAWNAPRAGGGSELCVFQAGASRRLARGHDGTLLDESSAEPQLDRAGRFLVFASHASNWVAGDSNGVCDIFCHDLQTGTTQQILPPKPGSGVTSSYRPAISADGRRIAYITYGVADTNNVRGRNACVYDRQTQRTEQLPRQPDRGVGPVLGRPSFSPGGNRVAFSAFSYDLLPLLRDPIHYEIYLMELETSSKWPPTRNEGLGGWWPVALLSQRPDGGTPDAHCYEPVLREDECFFVSQASNLVVDDQNGSHDIFVRPLWRDAPLQRLTHGNNSSFEPAVSQDGRYVAFTSYSDNLVLGDNNTTSDVFLLDRTTSKLQCLSFGLPGPSYRPAISDDGSRVAFISQNKAGHAAVYLFALGALKLIAEPAP